LWSDEKPKKKKKKKQLEQNGRVVDRYETPLGMRSFSFEIDKGFILNGKPVKILGTCNHHDLGALGAAINTRALERQLEMLKAMGSNALRTSHNPPAPELLELADRMGFIVMDEAFDVWKQEKTKFDYHLDWDEWHRRDLEDMVLRDRNHPSIFIWSIGNEVAEQWTPNPEAGRIGRLFNRHGFPTLDLTDDELAKEHVRHMVGGRSELAHHERLLSFIFPERPGALMRFLSALHPGWNISLFHYRNQGADYGRILVGIQVPAVDNAAFDEFLDTLAYPYTDETRNPAYRLFLR